MPSPGDTNNLGPNLTTLADLNTTPAGTKLSYNSASGRFSIQEPGIKQRLARTIWRESIETEESFGTPIRELFVAAHEVNHRYTADALNGLRTLCRSYDGAKLLTLNAVINDAELGVKKDQAHKIRFRERYNKYSVFGFAQSMFLPENSEGVSYSLTVHWARRILMEKTYFGSQDGDVRSTRLSYNEMTRMKKLVKRLQPLERSIGPASDHFTTFLHQKSLDPTFYRDRFFNKFGEMRVIPVTERKQPIERSARGAQVMKAFYRAAVEERKNGQDRIFLVNFSKETQHHTIGIHLPDEALHFFDPNCGEFNIPRVSGKDLMSFFDDWWQAFYVVGGRAAFTHWGLESVRRPVDRYVGE